MYCNHVADLTVDALDSTFPGFKEKYSRVLSSPESFGFDFFADDLDYIPAAPLYMICNYILTGNVVSYGSARPLSVEQTEITNRAIVEAFENLEPEFEESSESDAPEVQSEEDEFFEALQERFNLDGIEISEEETRLYAQMFVVISELVHHKLDFMELYISYDFLSDVITRRAPQFVVDFPREDIISVQCRALEHLELTSGKLTLEEKIRYAYCVYYSLFIRLFDEETGETKSGLSDFRSADHIEQCFQQHRELAPECYEFVDKGGSVDESPHDSSTFGYSEDNPIPVLTVPDAYGYLNCLAKPGYLLSYERVCSCQGPNGIIDKYKVFALPEGNTTAEPDVYEIYIDPYAQVNSYDAPEGFILRVPE